MDSFLQAERGGQAPGDLDLARFVAAQHGVYEQVLSELRQGTKRSHWMWFIFPQLRGLGRSAMAHTYGIAGIGEARAYLAHPILGSRLIACTGLAVDADKASATQIFPYPDDLKFHSSMTLFAHAAQEPDVFGAALQKYYGGEPDAQTLRLLEGDGAGGA